MKARRSLGWRKVNATTWYTRMFRGAIFGEIIERGEECEWRVCAYGAHQNVSGQGTCKNRRAAMRKVHSQIPVEVLQGSQLKLPGVKT